MHFMISFMKMIFILLLTWPDDSIFIFRCRRVPTITLGISSHAVAIEYLNQPVFTVPYIALTWLNNRVLYKCRSPNYPTFFSDVVNPGIGNIFTRNPCESGKQEHFLKQSVRIRESGIFLLVIRKREPFRNPKFFNFCSKNPII